MVSDTSRQMTIAYKGAKGIDLKVKTDGETVWLTQEQMCMLFGRDQSVIARHIANVFKEGELEKNSVYAKFAYTATDGKTYQVAYYNQAVRRNLDKFPQGYFFELTKDEANGLRSQIVTASTPLRSQIVTLEDSVSARGKHSKHGYKAFTEKGLYMLATILKSEQATAATLAIIETFAKVRELKRELVALHTETDKKAQPGKIKLFGELLADIVMPDLSDVETESSLELNFLIGKIKHTVRRIKRKGARHER